MFCLCRSAFQKQLQQQQRSKSTAAAAERIEPSRLLIGSQGEILDMALIPSTHAANAAATNGFRMALITNSTQVRVVDERFNCTVLEGHRDIVLCVDTTPDG
jgi:hypothetical protein